MTAATRLAIAVTDGDAALAQRAEALASELGLAVVDRAAVPVDVEMLLLVTPAGLALEALRGPATLTAGKPFLLDFRHIDATSGPGRSLRQPLLRAVGLRKGDADRPTVLDATAGLGEDAWLLAAVGCEVLAVERSAVMVALLRDALARAAAHDPEAHRRIAVRQTDSNMLLQRLVDAPDNADAAHALPWPEAPQVVYIDPMFPPGRRTLERKPMRLLRQLVGEDEDAAALLPLAQRVARRRVVVKRPLKAAPLAELPPDATHRGSSVRYDVYGSRHAMGG